MTSRRPSVHNTDEHCPPFGPECPHGGQRVAELLSIPADEHAAKIEEWFVADQRPKEWRNYYGPTRSEIEELHNRKCSAEELRARIKQWRLDADASVGNPKEVRTHNIRALGQVEQIEERSIVRSGRVTHVAR